MAAKFLSWCLSVFLLFKNFDFLSFFLSILRLISYNNPSCINHICFCFSIIWKKIRPLTMWGSLRLHENSNYLQLLSIYIKLEAKNKNKNLILGCALSRHFTIFSTEITKFYPKNSNFFQDSKRNPIAFKRFCLRLWDKDSILYVNKWKWREHYLIRSIPLGFQYVDISPKMRLIYSSP